MTLKKVDEIVRAEICKHVKLSMTAGDEVIKKAHLDVVDALSFLLIHIDPVEESA